MRNTRSMSGGESLDRTTERDSDSASDLRDMRRFYACHAVRQIRWKTSTQSLLAHKSRATNLTLLRLASPTEPSVVTGPVSRSSKSDGHFRIARYPKIGVQTIPSENYCEQIIQCKRKGTPSKLCLGSTPRAKGESIVRILGASQRTSQTSGNCRAHSTALIHRNLTFDASGRAAAIHFFNPSGGSSD